VRALWPAACGYISADCDSSRIENLHSAEPGRPACTNHPSRTWHWKWESRPPQEILNGYGTINATGGTLAGQRQGTVVIRLQF
jgi:hypothetical protein